MNRIPFGQTLAAGRIIGAAGRVLAAAAMLSPLVCVLLLTPSRAATAAVTDASPAQALQDDTSGDAAPTGGKGLDQFLNEIRSTYQQREWVRHFALYETRRLEEIVSRFRRQTSARSSTGIDPRVIDLFDACEGKVLDELPPTEFMVRLSSWMPVLLCEVPPSPFEPGTRVGEARDGDVIHVFYLPDKAGRARGSKERSVTVIETSEGWRYLPDEAAVQAIESALGSAVQQLTKNPLPERPSPSLASRSSGASPKPSPGSAPGGAASASGTSTEQSPCAEFARDVEVPPIPITGDVIPPKLVERFQPAYPETARRAHREGRIVLDAIIDKDGSVIGTKVLKAPWPSFGLVRESIETVRRWRYEPAMLRGEPVKVRFTIVVDFTLSGDDEHPRCL